MLGFFRGKGKRKENKNENIIYTPCKGTVVPITEVPDPVGRWICGNPGRRKDICSDRW